MPTATPGFGDATTRQAISSPTVSMPIAQAQLQAHLTKAPALDGAIRSAIGILHHFRGQSESYAARRSNATGEW